MKVEREEKTDEMKLGCEQDWQSVPSTDSRTVGKHIKLLIHLKQSPDSHMN